MSESEANNLGARQVNLIIPNTDQKSKDFVRINIERENAEGHIEYTCMMVLHFVDDSNHFYVNLPNGDLFRANWHGPVRGWLFHWITRAMDYNECFVEVKESGRRAEIFWSDDNPRLEYLIFSDDQEYACGMIDFVNQRVMDRDSLQFIPYYKLNYDKWTMDANQSVYNPFWLDDFIKIFEEANEFTAPEWEALSFIEPDQLTQVIQIPDPGERLTTEQRDTLDSGNSLGFPVGSTVTLISNDSGTSSVPTRPMRRFQRGQWLNGNHESYTELMRLEMTTAQRESIENPEHGTYVYDLDYGSFFIYSHDHWSEISEEALSSFASGIILQPGLRADGTMISEEVIRDAMESYMGRIRQEYPEDEVNITVNVDGQLVQEVIDASHPQSPLDGAFLSRPPENPEGWIIQQTSPDEIMQASSAPLRPEEIVTVRHLDHSSASPGSIKWFADARHYLNFNIKPFQFPDGFNYLDEKFLFNVFRLKKYPAALQSVTVHSQIKALYLAPNPWDVIEDITHILKVPGRTIENGPALLPEDMGLQVELKVFETGSLIVPDGPTLFFDFDVRYIHIDQAIGDFQLILPGPEDFDSKLIDSDSLKGLMSALFLNGREWKASSAEWIVMDRKNFFEFGPEQPIQEVIQPDFSDLDI